MLGSQITIVVVLILATGSRKSMDATIVIVVSYDVESSVLARVFPQTRHHCVVHAENIVSGR